MPSSFSPNLRFEEIQNGEQANTWGTTTNNNIGNLIEQAIAGLVQVDVTGADVTLLALDGASDQARNMFIEVIGTPGATRNVYCPNGDTKVYIVINNSNAPVNFSTVSGTGVSIPGGGHQFLYSDGTNVLNAVTSVYTFDPNLALVSSPGGNIAESITTAAQIGYLSNVTGDVQAQLNSKLPNTTGVSSQLLANNGAGGVANVNVGSGLSYNTSTNTISSTAGGGSVTSVAMTVPSGFTLTGSPITGAGTLALGLSASLNNQLLYVNGAGALSAASTSGSISFSGGTLTGSGVTSLGFTAANGFTGNFTTGTNPSLSIGLNSGLSGVLAASGGSIVQAVPGSQYLVPDGALGTPSSGTLTNCSGYTWTNVSGRPTVVSAFTNDAGYITSSALSPYLTITSAASTYLTQTNAASTYLTQTNAASTYLTQTNAASTYVALTGSQTIAGTKTFSSTISGNVSGNAGTVTNGVYTTDFTGNQALADPGYQTFPGGLKIKFGSGSASAASGGTYNAFNVSFPTACVAVVFTVINGSAPGNSYVVTSKTTAGFYALAASSFSMSYIAIGY
jgi:hypothetical protein